MIILIMTTIIIIIIIIFLLPFQLFCRICLAFSFTFHVSCFFVKDLDLAVDSTIQRVSKERSICCAKLRSVAKIHHIWIRCWRPGGIGEGGKGMTGARLSGSEFFLVLFWGASLWRSKRRLWFQFRELTKSWTVFDSFVPKRRCCFKRGVQCLQPLEETAIGIFDALGGGVKPLIFWWKKWHDMLLSKRPQESSSRTIHFCNK